MPVLDPDVDPFPVDAPSRRRRRRSRGAVPPHPFDITERLQLRLDTHGNGNKPLAFDDELSIPGFGSAVAAALVPAALGGLGLLAGHARFDVHRDHVDDVWLFLYRRGRRWWGRRRRQQDHRRWLDNQRWRRRWWWRWRGYDGRQLLTHCLAAHNRWLKIEHLAGIAISRH